MEADLDKFKKEVKKMRLKDTITDHNNLITEFESVCDSLSIMYSLPDELTMFGVPKCIDILNDLANDKQPDASELNGAHRELEWLSECLSKLEEEELSEAAFESAKIIGEYCHGESISKRKKILKKLAKKLVKVNRPYMECKWTQLYNRLNALDNFVWTKDFKKLTGISEDEFNDILRRH